MIWIKDINFIYKPHSFIRGDQDEYWKKVLKILLNSFYNYYFVDYLEEIISDENEEYSLVLLIESTNYFIELVKKLNISIEFNSLEEYLKLYYLDYGNMYKKIIEKYNKEERFRENMEKIEF